MSDIIDLMTQPRGRVVVPEGDSLIIVRCDDSLIALSTVGGRTVTTVADREAVNTYDDPAIAGWCGYCDCAVIRCSGCGTVDCAEHMDDRTDDDRPLCSACWDDENPYCGECDSTTCDHCD